VKGEQIKLSTGAKRGLDPTPETIREGSVRMEQYPEYANTLAKIKELGFEIKITQDDPHVKVKEVLNPQKEVVRVLKVVYVQEGMRYLDLEHELGHIRQLTVPFGDKCLIGTRKSLFLISNAIEISRFILTHDLAPINPILHQ
jgi:hypothetical protein